MPKADWPLDKSLNKWVCAPNVIVKEEQKRHETSCSLVPMCVWLFFLDSHMLVN